MIKNKEKNVSEEVKVKGPSQTLSEHQFALKRGWVYWFDPTKKTQIDSSPLVVILSNVIHNQNSDHIIVALASGKNIKPTENTFEVYCEVENRKLRVLLGQIHTIHKSTFFGRAIYLGGMKEESKKEINEKLKFILQSDN